MLLLNSGREIKLTSVGSAVVQSVRQAIEVLTGQFVELGHLPISLGPASDLNKGTGRLERIERDVSVTGSGRHCQTDEWFTISARFKISKNGGEKSHSRWEIKDAAEISLEIRDRKTWYEEGGNIPSLYIPKSGLSNEINGQW